MTDWNQDPIPPSNHPHPAQPTDSSAPSTAQPAQSATQQMPAQGGAYQAPEFTQPYATQRIPNAAGTVAPAAAPARKQGFGKTFLAGFLGAALACAVAGGGLAAYSLTHDGSSSPGGTTILGSSSDTTISASTDDDRAEAVADKVLPSVAGINVYTSDGSSSWGQLFDSGSDSLTYSGLGSGVIISADGYILTNYHVVQGADALKVTANGQTYDAQVVGTDETSDLAVIKVEADDLTAIEIGSSADLVPGQWVMTAGSPFGLEQSVATGIVSATSRTVTVQSSTDEYSYYFGQGSGDMSIYSNMIQTDAAINPGNSGGALVDGDGKLIGINSVIESYSGSYSGVGFAIPVDYAMNIAQQIIDGKTPTHAQLGVSATTITSDIASRYNLGAEEGAYLSAIYEGSAASEAGLKEGDIITAVDDTAITSSTDLVAACRSRQVGDTVTVTFVRDGKEQKADVTLGSDEDTLGASASQESTGGDSGNFYGQDGSSGNGFEFGFSQGYSDSHDGSSAQDAAA